MVKFLDILYEMIEGKDDRCLRIARRKYDKPSAYRSGAIVRCRQGKIWKGLKEEDFVEEKESLHKWFSRKGGTGGAKGWVDCNTCREVDGKKKCKPCGRQKGETRAKYPSCRPTPSQCSRPGKGKSWEESRTRLSELYLILILLKQVRTKQRISRTLLHSVKLRMISFLEVMNQSITLLVQQVEDYQTQKIHSLLSYTQLWD